MIRPADFVVTATGLVEPVVESRTQPPREEATPVNRKPLTVDEWVQPLPGGGVHQPPGQVVRVVDSPVDNDQVVMVQVDGRGSRGMPYLLEASKLHRVEPPR